MSGFDVTMRSQAMVNQSQQFYDAQRYQSMDQVGRTAMAAPGMIQELMLRQQDGEMRLALQQQEYQSNAMKLQAMSAIDQADLMREQVESAKLQNEAVRFDMEMRKKQFDRDSENSYEANYTRLVSALGGGRGLAASGLTYDPTKPPSERIRVMTEAERADYEKRRGTDDGITEINARRNTLTSLYRAATDEGDLEAADQYRRELHELARQQGWVSEQAAPAPTRQPQVGKQPLTGIDKDLVDELRYNTIIRGGQDGAIKPGDDERIVRWARANAADLLASKKAGATGSNASQLTEDAAVRDFLKILMNPQDERYAMVIQFLRDEGVIK